MWTSLCPVPPKRRRRYARIESKSRARRGPARRRRLRRRPPAGMNGRQRRCCLRASRPSSSPNDPLTFRCLTEVGPLSILIGPRLIISGGKDHTVPWAFAHASFQQQDNGGVTEIVEIKGRGHALTIDSGYARPPPPLAFVKRVHPAGHPGAVPPLPPRFRRRYRPADQLGDERVRVGTSKRLGQR